MPSLPHFHALILAGGRGTRFWPRSRRAHAKQVLPVVGGESLIQQTYARLRPLMAPGRFWVITNGQLRDQIIRQLPEALPEQVIAEPAGRNTAPCIGLAARILLAIDPEAVMGVFPSDQVISRPAAFRRVLRRAVKAAASGELVVLGIRPRGPETGYGYIEFPPGARSGAGPVRIRGFREKPKLALARRFLRRGNFSWNSGMFLWRASVIDQALREHLPRTASVLDRVRGQPGEPVFARSLAAHYPRCQNISIDYAVMEKARRVAGFRCEEFGWNDVGSWSAVYDLLPRDRQGNIARTEAMFLNSKGSYVDAPGKLVALAGVDDLVVVETPDALLVTRRDRAQMVGDVVKALEKQGRGELL